MAIDFFTLWLQQRQNNSNQFIGRPSDQVVKNRVGPVECTAIFLFVSAKKAVNLACHFLQFTKLTNEVVPQSYC